ncbi:b(0,+)-type amino acid transporter 1-like [Haliotis rufescens]|uniref:b(0,+)-type amino acid transporter 1-like n=1 Tax=Haliotis rufescens TaxID=6454 RepID=UPI00201E7639|nr:b(0,+)-type amino acid transporter 1-like [Haliotis rufescens]
MTSSGATVKRRVSWREPNRLTDVWVTPESGDEGGAGKGGPGHKHVDFTLKPNAPADGGGSDLKEIGLIYGGSLIAQTLIGPGIFTSPKGVLEGSGSIAMSLVIWAACGVFSTMAALCFTELRESVRKEGVEYAYISEAFGPVTAFVYCWMRIAAAEPVGTAVFCAAFADYTADFIYDGCGPSDKIRKSLAILALVSLALLNGLSNKLASQVQILATVGKVTALAVVIILGITRLFQGHYTILQGGFEGTTDNPTSITFAIFNGLWAYGGWSNVNHVTRGVKKPPRNLPRLVKFVIPLVMVIYMLVVTSYFTVMTKHEMLSSEAIAVTWGERMLGKASAIIPIGVGLTALGSANGTFLTAGRLSGVALKDGNMPEFSSWVHVRSKTNIITLISRALIAILMLMFGSLAVLVRFFVFTVWLFHGLSILALLVLRVKNKAKSRPYKVNIAIPIVVVAIIACFSIAPFLQAPKPEFIVSLALVVFSLILYIPKKFLKINGQFSEKFQIYLQLILRIAPRRALKRLSIARRKSIVRRASLALARRHSMLRMEEESVLRRRTSLAVRRASAPTISKPAGIIRRSHTFSEIQRPLSIIEERTPRETTPPDSGLSSDQDTGDERFNFQVDIEPQNDVTRTEGSVDSGSIGSSDVEYVDPFADLDPVMLNELFSLRSRSSESSASSSSMDLNETASMTDDDLDGSSSTTSTDPNLDSELDAELFAELDSYLVYDDASSDDIPYMQVTKL